MTLKIIIITLMGIFYICYFSKMISQRKKGIKTDQLGKGKEGFFKFIELALKLITYTIPILQVFTIFTFDELVSLWRQVLGILLTVLGVMIFIISILQMKDNWRAGVQRDEKTNLVTGGIYTISRNPAFLGFNLMYVGILTTFFHWYLCLATILAVIFFHLQIVYVEEPFLVEKFGKAYLDYKHKVYRYFGKK